MKISKFVFMLEATLGFMMLGGCCYTNLPQPCMPPPVIISPPPCYPPCYYLQPVFQTPTLSTYPSYNLSPCAQFGPAYPYCAPPPPYPGPYPYIGMRFRGHCRY